ncbi:glycoside hydrolase family 172 protein [Niabella beijingensis]|uniref:glycoside hydrolase family 172 protein n=1 Tax=Niabella beijingensis TaxID=2872700 RepID=UPI001CC04708|nr:glycoside hydrolase family 172 protein [Niabella beijingensis]MBZ4188869.1 DUF2961 domain-containing protein [Niabella beijingensis]
MKKYIVCFIAFFPLLLSGQELFQFPEDTETSWVSFENPTGKKGQGGKENNGAKGHAWDNIQPGQSKELFNVHTTGIIKRIWMTIADRSPRTLRSVRIDIYWDGAERPAVSAPLGDFFGMGLGRMTAFQNAFFSEAEGKSFNCFIPMPFKKEARIVLTNESPAVQTLFFDVNFLKVKSLEKGALYFHTFWSNNVHTSLGDDFAVLPEIQGQGRFLGANFGIITDSSYGNSWWGEGEVKIYLDGDHTYPSLVGTGTEDYLGTGWGQGTFVNDYTGCLSADEKSRCWTFYRYHVPDPVYFKNNCRVSVQQMGGDNLAGVRSIFKKGAALIPVSVTASDYGKQWNLAAMKQPPALTDSHFPNGWVNFFRKDNYSATAYFYLDKPESGLPLLQPLKERLTGIAN